MAVEQIYLLLYLSSLAYFSEDSLSPTMLYYASLVLMNKSCFKKKKRKTRLSRERATPRSYTCHYVLSFHCQDLYGCQDLCFYISFIFKFWYGFQQWVDCLMLSLKKLSESELLKSRF